MTAGAPGRFSRQAQGGAAASTLEALVFELRQRGAAALQQTSAQRRLDELNEPQLREVVKRLIGLRAQYPKIDDALLLQLGDRLP